MAQSTTIIGLYRAIKSFYRNAHAEAIEHFVEEVHKVLPDREHSSPLKVWVNRE